MPEKEDELLEFKRGESFINLAIEFQVLYQDDEQKRGGGGHALKIYDQGGGGAIKQDDH